jgi:hypothetical protein
MTLPLQRNPVDRRRAFVGGDFGVDVAGEFGVGMAGEFLGECFGVLKVYVVKALG